MYEVVDASTETNEPFPTLKVRWSSPLMTPVVGPIERLEQSEDRFYCIELGSLKTELPDGEYDTVFLRLARLEDGTFIDMYQRTKARLTVENGRFVRRTIRKVCSECVAFDPHHYLLEEIVPSDSKTVVMRFGSYPLQCAK